jgi:hypothetical protein
VYSIAQNHSINASSVGKPGCVPPGPSIIQHEYLTFPQKARPVIFCNSHVPPPPSGKGEGPPFKKCTPTAVAVEAQSGILGSALHATK